MRLLIDEHKFSCGRRAVYCQVFTYTNHTLMSEARPVCWENFLRHLQIIFEINDIS